MKHQWKWIIILAALALILGGAYLLYEALSDSYVPGGDIALPSEKETESEARDLPTPSESETEQESNSETDEESESESETESASHSVPAPAITFYNYDGTPVSLSDLVGKPVVLNFWASWCPPCKAEMPEFEAAFEAYGDRIHFVMVNVTDGIRETKQTAHSFIADMGYTFPVYYDTSGTAYTAFLAYTGGSLPASFFIDRNGNLKGYFVGQLSPDIMEQGIDLILD